VLARGVGGGGVGVPQTTTGSGTVAGGGTESGGSADSLGGASEAALDGAGTLGDASPMDAAEPGAAPGSTTSAVLGACAADPAAGAGGGPNSTLALVAAPADPWLGTTGSSARARAANRSPAQTGELRTSSPAFRTFAGFGKRDRRTAGWPADRIAGAPVPGFAGEPSLIRSRTDRARRNPSSRAAYRGARDGSGSCGLLPAAWDGHGLFEPAVVDLRHLL
jgi:hypothetical protein